VWSPVAVHVPGVCAIAFVAGVPVTDLLNPAKAKSRPTKQSEKPIKARGLKKAHREVDFVFIRIVPLALVDSMDVRSPKRA